MKRKKDTKNLFILAVKKIISDKKIKQKDIAEKLNINASELSAFLGARKNFSEIRREQLSEILGYSYIDLLFLGKKIYEGKQNYNTQQKLNPEGIELVKIIKDYRDMNNYLKEQIKKIEIENEELKKELGKSSGIFFKTERTR